MLKKAGTTITPRLLIRLNHPGRERRGLLENNPEVFQLRRSNALAGDTRAAVKPTDARTRHACNQPHPILCAPAYKGWLVRDPHFVRKERGMF